MGLNKWVKFWQKHLYMTCKIYGPSISHHKATKPYLNGWMVIKNLG